MEQSVEELVSNGDKFFQKEKLIDAIREYQKAFEIIGTKEDDDTADLAYKLSQAYNALEGKNDQNSVKYAQISLDIHRKNNQKDLEVLDLINLGYIELDAGKKDESEKYFNEALSIADSLKDPFLFCTTLNALAEIKATSAKGKEEAARIYENVMKISEETQDWDNYFEARRGLITIIREKQNEDEALKNALDALDMIDRIAGGIKNKKERKEFRKSLSFMYDLASDIAMEMENVDEAIKIAQRSNAE